MAVIFHIIPKSDWETVKQQGKTYAPETLKKEGFIHCSQSDQVKTVADNLYQGQKGLLLLRIIQEKVKAEIKWEPPLEAPWSGILFPHIYGELNLDSVDKVIDFPPQDNGMFDLPKGMLG